MRNGTATRSSGLVIIGLLVTASMLTGCFPPALEQDVDSTSDTDTEVEPDPDTPIDADTSSDTDTVPDTDTSSDTDAIPDTDTETSIDTDTATDTDTSTDTAPMLNACGGLATLSPGEPGVACGTCLDGELECDPADPNHNTTRCAGDSVRNACNGCGQLAATLGSECGECGLVICDGTSGTRCAEPVDGCGVPLVCADLACAAEQRSCIESDGESDARCGGCLATFVDVDGQCLGVADPPTGVTATTDLEERVLVSWNPSLHATAYRVYRCPGTCTDTGPWTEPLAVAITGTSLPDQTASAPSAPPAPGLTASTNRPLEVEVQWTSVVAPTSPRYSYRVVAIGPSGPSTPSEITLGQLAERPVTGYELSIAGGPWQLVEGSSFRDIEAAPPTLNPGSVTATQGHFADKVALTASDWSKSDGASRQYRVRARTRFATGAEASATGRRSAGAVSLTWERSSGPSPLDFSTIATTAAQATTVYEDSQIPAHGVVRYYRGRLSAEGASPVTTEAVAGWRMPLPDVPQIVSVSTDLTDRVEVRWAPTDLADSYHLYRNGNRLSPLEGVTCSSSPCVYIDNTAPSPGSWGAPTGVSATTHRTTGVTVTWTLPSRPSETSQTYEVSAINPAGESDESTEVAGWRSVPPLEAVEVKTTANGVESTYTLAANATTFDHTLAPSATFAASTLTATQGAHRDHVLLSLVEGALNPAAPVTYQLRAVFVGGTTPWTTETSGRRSFGAVTRSWQYATELAPDSWVVMPTEICTALGCEDTAASPLGEARRYRVVLSAAGATNSISPVAEGWRLAFKFVSGGVFYTRCAVDTQGRLWVWGRYREAGGAPGDAAEQGTLLPRVRSQGPFAECTTGGNLAFLGPGFGCARSPSGNVWCGSFLTDEPLVERTDLGAGVKSISVGSDGACAVKSDGHALCWGSGQLLGDLQGSNSLNPVVVVQADGEPLSGLEEVDVDRHHACARTSGGAVWCWGYNGTGEIEGEDTDTRLYAKEVVGLTGVTHISLGSDHTCAGLANGELRCMGFGGAIGSGTGTNAPAPTPVLLQVDPPVVLNQALQVSALGNTSCARRTSDTLCWGSGWEGDRGDGTFETNAFLPRTVLLPGPASHIGATCAIVDGMILCWGGRHLGDGTTTARSTPGEVLLP